MITGSKSQMSNVNLPNAITIVRILLAPIFLWVLLADDGELDVARWVAACIFIVAIASDGIDGYIARRYNLITDLGKLLDPIADKILVGSALIGLYILGELPLWITIVILIREFGVTVHRILVASDHVVAAAWMGKLKTVIQAVAVSLALLPLAPLVGDWFVAVNIVAMFLAVALTIASGIDYVVTEIIGARGSARE